MITISNNAIVKIKDILTAEQKPDSFLRVGIKGGGCSGFSYILDLADKQSENDQVLDYEGVKVLIDNKSMIYLAGTELDYTDGLNGAGFVFNNPNAVKTCGCGNSFAV
jgi:iron-sulfur cluster assembly protein